MKIVSPSQIRRSALAPTSIRPRSSRSSAFAPLSVAALKTSAAVATARLAVNDLADDGGPAQTFEHRLRGGIGAESHVDAGFDISGEGFHCDAATGKDPDAVGDIGAGAGQDRDVISGVIRPRRASEDDGMADEDVGAEEADIFQPFDRTVTCASDDLVELIDRLSGVQGDWNAHFVSGLFRFA